MATKTLTLHLREDVLDAAILRQSQADARLLLAALRRTGRLRVVKRGKHDLDPGLYAIEFAEAKE